MEGQAVREMAIPFNSKYQGLVLECDDLMMYLDCEDLMSRQIALAVLGELKGQGIVKLTSEQDSKFIEASKKDMMNKMGAIANRPTSKPLGDDLCNDISSFMAKAVMEGIQGGFQDCLKKRQG